MSKLSSVEWKNIAVNSTRLSGLYAPFFVSQDMVTKIEVQTLFFRSCLPRSK